MAYPYSAPANDKTDNTSTPTDHPAHHNALANALVDLLAELGTNPSGAVADLTSRLSTLDTTVAAKALAADLTAEIATRAAADLLLIPLTQRAANNGVATLDGTGVIPVAQMPSITITNTFVVGSQAAMLATGAHKGDVAIRTDLSQNYILAGSDPTILGNWSQLLTPADAVSSVNGRQGAVTGLAEQTSLDTEVTNRTSAVASAVQRANHTGTQTSATISDLATVVKAYRIDEFAVPTSATAWNNKRLTGLGDATAAADALNRQTGDARYGQLSGATFTGKTNYSAGVKITDDDGVTSIDGYRALLDIRPPNADPEVVGITIKLPGTAWGIGQDYAEGNYMVGLSDADNFGATTPANILKTITATTNATPVQVTTAAHGLTTGDIVRITDTGIAALDGKWWKITVVDTTNVTLDGSTAPGSTAAVGNLFTDRSPVLWRFADSGPGWTGAMHLAAGLRGRSGSAIPTYGFWIQPAADLIPLLIHNAATDKLATAPTSDYMSIIDARAALVKRFAVNAAGQTLHDPGVTAAPGISFVGVPDTGFTYGGGFLSAVVAGVAPASFIATGIIMSDAMNIQTNATTGTKIATTVTQKLGLWGATPVIQPKGASQAAVAATGSTNTTPFGYTTAAQADAIVTLVNAIRTALVNTGIMKGAA